MKPWTYCLRLGWLPILMLLWTTSSQAQDPAALGGVAVAPAGAAEAAAGGPNLFKFLLPDPAMMERCRAKLCKCNVVKMLKNMMKPMALGTGGLIQFNCCPEITKEDLLKAATDPTSSEGAAAAIKKDLAEAGARREAIRFLSTVDCRYWPEAEEALIAGLRSDKVECVRFESAMALQRGCCCTKKVVKALTIVIEGTDKDGFPAERSQRVIDASAVALSMCVIEEPAVKKDPDIKIEIKKAAKVDPKEFYRELDKNSRENILDGARKALQKNGTPTASGMLSHPHRAQSFGVFGMIGHAYESAQETPTREPAPIVATTYAQPQRRGLLYKLIPGMSSEETTYVAAPASESVPMIVNGPRNEVRQSGWVTGNSTPAAPAPATPTTGGGILSYILPR